MKTKTEKKKADKIVQDRTFGLKNKNKSKVVQKFVKGVEQTVKFANMSSSQLEAEEFEKRKLRKKEEEEKALLSSLYNDVNRLKDAEESDEEDPSTVVCPYYKQGICQKGKKCIYSHDLTLDRCEDIDLYVDQRTQLIMNAIGGKELNSLTEQELNKAIGEKQREIIKGCRSDIVCKFFLQSVEKNKYGWNWTCPNNGDRCKYKHCLPPGYRLKRDGGNSAVEEQINIEERIDEQRNKLLAENRSSPLVTYEVFLKWKEDRRIRKESDAQKKKLDQEKRSKVKAQLRTGRELFSLDPTLFVDDEEAADEYEQEEIIEEEPERDEEEREDGEEEEKEERIDADSEERAEEETEQIEEKAEV